MILDDPAGLRALNNQLKSQEAMGCKSLEVVPEEWCPPEWCPPPPFDEDPEFGGGNLFAKAPYIDVNNDSNLDFGLAYTQL